MVTWLENDYFESESIGLLDWTFDKDWFNRWIEANFSREKKLAYFKNYTSMLNYYIKIFFFRMDT